MKSMFVFDHIYTAQLHILESDQSATESEIFRLPIARGAYVFGYEPLFPSHLEFHLIIEKQRRMRYI